MCGALDEKRYEREYAKHYDTSNIYCNCDNRYGTCVGY